MCNRDKNIKIVKANQFRSSITNKKLIIVGFLLYFL